MLVSIRSISWGSFFVDVLEKQFPNLEFDDVMPDARDVWSQLAPEYEIPLIESRVIHDKDGWRGFRFMVKNSKEFLWETSLKSILGVKSTSRICLEFLYWLITETDWADIPDEICMREGL